MDPHPGNCFKRCIVSAELSRKKAALQNCSLRADYKTGTHSRYDWKVKYPSRGNNAEIMLGGLVIDRERLSMPLSFEMSCH